MKIIGERGLSITHTTITRRVYYPKFVSIQAKPLIISFTVWIDVVHRS